MVLNPQMVASQNTPHYANIVPVLKHLFILSQFISSVLLCLLLKTRNIEYIGKTGHNFSDKKETQRGGSDVKILGAL